jgi:hypothetical protein
MGVSENDALIDAAMAGNEAGVRAAIAAGADLNCRVRPSPGLRAHALAAWLALRRSTLTWRAGGRDAAAPGCGGWAHGGGGSAD